MNIESLIHIISHVRNEYEKSYNEFSKQKFEDLTERINQIRDLATLDGAIYALDKVLELVEETRKVVKE